jgi:hypothetical protein
MVYEVLSDPVPVICAVVDESKVSTSPRCRRSSCHSFYRWSVRGHSGRRQRIRRWVTRLRSDVADNCRSHFPGVALSPTSCDPASILVVQRPGEQADPSRQVSRRLVCDLSIRFLGKQQSPGLSARGIVVPCLLTHHLRRAYLGVTGQTLTWSGEPPVTHANRSPLLRR